MFAEIFILSKKFKYTNTTCFAVVINSLGKSNTFSFGSVGPFESKQRITWTATLWQQIGKKKSFWYKKNMLQNNGKIKHLGW
jgi:hypothetical protein